jgi:uncharacterized membrane protein YgcG
MIRKALIIAAAGIAIAAAGSLTSRANAMPLGMPADTADQMNLVDPVALCFYVDGWNGPGLYECGYRFRRGFGWHGARRGGGRVGIRGGGGGRHFSGGGGRHGGGGGRGGRGGGRRH